MTIFAIWQLILPGALLGAGFRYLFASEKRCARDRLRDLGNSGKFDTGGRSPPQVSSSPSEGPLRSVLMGAVIGAAVSLHLTAISLAQTLVFIVIGAALGTIISHGRSRAAQEKRKRSLDYFLPIVMERIVMAVESGLDILPAIGAVVRLEEDANATPDPVSELFSEISRYTESGITLSCALTLIEQQVDRPALRHALVHLGLAHREGGEIIHPLRELSDATQLYFQESVEEEIAKMPIKATLPLLCTFGGLIISFLTAPLVQVMMITTQAAPGVR